jgi:hypothetical protein
MAFRPGPSAARRLLQPIRSASTTADRPIPAPHAKAFRGRACEPAWNWPACALALRSPRSPASAWHGRAGAHPYHGRRGFSPCTEHGQRCSKRGTRPRPRATASTATSRGFTGQGPVEPKPHLARPLPRAPGDWRALVREHYPNPIRSDTSRHETVAAPAGDSSAARSLRFQGDPWRSHRASPTPAKGRSSWTQAGRLRGHIRGRGPLRPPFREEERGLLGPRCLPPGSRSSTASTRPRPRPRAVRTERVRSGISPQVVTNLWRMVDAFCNLTGSAALDGAAGTRSSRDA